MSYLRINVQLCLIFVYKRILGDIRLRVGPRIDIVSPREISLTFRGYDVVRVQGLGIRVEGSGIGTFCVACLCVE